MASDLIKDAREAFDAGMQADQENRIAAVDDLKFLAGEQWPAYIKAQRGDQRPALTFNRLPQYERQVTGDMRLNPPAINVRPVDSGADPKTAKTLTGLIRNIEAQSDGPACYLAAATNAVRAGEGWFGVTYGYVEDSFDMELAFRRIPSPLAVVCDPGATEVHRGDASWMFACEMIPTATFKLLHPKASLTGFDDPSVGANWRSGDFIRVAEWWRKKPIKRRLMLLTNGSVFDATDKDDAAIVGAIQQGGGFVKERQADGHKVCMTLLNGVEELDDDYDWPGRHIPLVRVGGDEINIGDRVVRYGIVRHAKEAQMLYNFQRTALAEVIAMAPKAKWIGTDKMFAGRQNEWANANTLNSAYLAFTVDKDMPQGPQRIAPEMPSAGLLQDAQMAAMDIEATIGMYRESLGKESNAISGKAILSRQREGDVGTYVYQDNLAQAVTQAGRILIDVLPIVYDTPRTVRVLGEDGKEEFAQLNGVVADANGQPVRINDISVGRYDVVASVGPSFSTRREEARESLMNFVSAVPQAAAVIADLLADAMDWPGSEPITKRLRLMAVQQGFAEPQEGDPPPKQQPPPPEAMLAQAEMAKAQAQMAKVEAEKQAQQIDGQIQMAKLVMEGERLKIEAHKVGAKIQIDQDALKLKGMEFAAEVADRVVTHQQSRAESVVGHLHKIADRSLSQQQAERSHMLAVTKPQEMPRPG